MKSLFPASAINPVYTKVNLVDGNQIVFALPEIKPPDITGELRNIAVETTTPRRPVENIDTNELCPCCKGLYSRGEVNLTESDYWLGCHILVIFIDL